ncbi:MAG: hypothetical protein AAGC55_08140 [Myxococcota bacterium]
MIAGTLVVVAAVGVLLWQLGEPPSPKQTDSKSADSKSAEEPTPGAAMVVSGGDKKPAAAPSARPSMPDTDDNGDDAEEVEMLEPGTDEYNRHIDVYFPGRFRAQAALCYDSDQRSRKEMQLSYDLIIVGGQVSVSNVRVVESDLSKGLEACMVEAVQKTTFRADNMPDFNEEQDLFIQLHSLKKYQPDNHELNF